MSSARSIGAFVWDLMVISVLLTVYVAVLSIQSTVELARRAVTGRSRRPVDDAGDPI